MYSWNDLPRKMHLARTAAFISFPIVLAVAALNGARGEDQQPPPDNHDWGREQEFWAFKAPAIQPVPTLKDKKWAAQPLDYFVLARLEEKKLSPSEAANKRTLVRRVTFDITGLPPLPQEVDQFVVDERPDAYRRLVDRLLSAPEFGERMASMWLPLARYAEDQAHQVGDDTKFFYPNAFKYREWVINAFNRDLPYDQFLKLQLAADKIEDDCKHDLAALGFLGLGPKYYDRGRIDVMADEWEDRVDTVSRTMLGLTVACARCHDHKFDPITSADYYAMAGVFASTKMVNLKPDGKEESKDASAQKMDPGTLHVVEDGEAKDLNVFIRGNPERKGPVAERRFIRVLCKGEPRRFTDGSGRKELAEAIACDQNPLTARVIVNRVWGMFFGKPLVPTPSNFGHLGQPPSNQVLLDDLAARFMKNGWSVKGLVREIALSSAYKQSSVFDAQKSRAALAADGANELLWRANRKRLSIEEWRDAVMFVAGELKPEGGKSLEVSDPENHRRTVYSRISRLKLNDTLTQFDYPDANVHAEKRAITTTPVQKLYMLNSPFMLTEAKAFAERIEASSKDQRSRVEQAYRMLYGRSPEKAEMKLGLKFLGEPQKGELTRWEEYAQMLLASNEMIYVD